jgi:hypothetical protein
MPGTRVRPVGRPEHRLLGRASTKANARQMIVCVDDRADPQIKSGDGHDEAEAAFGAPHASVS